MQKYVYLIDFGLSSNWYDNNGNHIELNAADRFVGT